MLLQVLRLLLAPMALGQACRCLVARMTPMGWVQVVAVVALGRRRNRHCRIRHIRCLCGAPRSN